MIFFKDDILQVSPLKYPYQSHVTKPYLVVVLSDDKDELVTSIPSRDIRKFDKSLQEWIAGHKYRFKKVGHMSDPVWAKRLLTQVIE